MLNQIVLVGRLVDEVTIQELENGKKEATLTLAVQRTYKNEDGIYETDFIKCILWNAIATSTGEYCHKGDIVGIKGRLQVTKNKTTVIAEKVTFLSSHKEEA